MQLVTATATESALEEYVNMTNRSFYVISYITVDANHLGNKLNWIFSYCSINRKHAIQLIRSSIYYLPNQA